MLTVTIYKGLPASGKDTHAEQLMTANPGKYKRVNKDLLREMCDVSKWSKDNEKFILKLRDIVILFALRSGKHVLVTDTNLHPKHEQNIRELVKGKAEVKIIDFTNVGTEECIKRDLKRQKSVGERVIRTMYNQFLRPPILEVKYNSKLPDCIICDLDGTLCGLNGRNPYNASTCENDLPNENLIKLIKRYISDYDTYTDRLHLIFLSGREDKYKPQTERWLTKYITIHYDKLFMRFTDDLRKDSIVKEEFYRNHIKGKYNVVAVFDDRLQVCQMWHRLGLPLFRVGDPDANF